MGNKKNIAVIMQKDSTRTRSAFEVAAFDLGMNVTYIGGTGSQMGKKESIEDTAKVLGGFYDGIALRCGSHADVATLGEHAGVPV
jgi:ornithine carbamoyltransferase